MTGWICLHRGWRDCEVFADEGPLSEREAWVWLLEHAAWKACFRRNAKGERVRIERGQFHTSLRTLGDAWQWGKNKVARFLERLEDHEMIGTASGQSGCIITITNYDEYQVQEDGRDSQTGTASGQSRDTQEQGKQVQQEESNPPTPQGGRDRGSKIPEDWTAPAVADLPPEAKSLATQWTAAAYTVEAVAFRDYWLGESSARARKSDWTKAWYNRITQIHSKVMRDAKFGNGPKAAPTSTAEPASPEARAAHHLKMAESYERMGNEFEAEDHRRRAEALSPRAKRPQAIGDLMAHIREAAA
jgi:hypothetical protein